MGTAKKIAKYFDMSIDALFSNKSNLKFFLMSCWFERNKSRFHHGEVIDSEYRDLECRYLMLNNSGGRYYGDF